MSGCNNYVLKLLLTHSCLTSQSGGGRSTSTTAGGDEGGDDEEEMMNEEEEDQHQYSAMARSRRYSIVPLFPIPLRRATALKSQQESYEELVARDFAIEERSDN